MLIMVTKKQEKGDRVKKEQEELGQGIYRFQIDDDVVEMVQ